MGDFAQLPPVLTAAAWGEQDVHDLGRSGVKALDSQLTLEVKNRS